MRRFARPSVCGWVLGAAALAAPAQAETQEKQTTLKVTHRFALLIGQSDGGPGRARLEHADDDVRAVKDVLVDLASVDRKDVRVVVDDGKDDVDAGFDALVSDVDDAKAKGERTEVVVYYSGHSDEQGLLLGTERYAWAALKARVAAVGADVKVVVLDSCASGAAVKKKGGTKRPPLLVDEKVAVRGQAYLTSSSADEASQESARLGGSYFTHALVTGLRGAADVSKDGLVTLDEAYRFAFHETLASTTTTSGGAQHANYDIQLSGAGEWVITDLRDVKDRLVLGKDVAGRVYVRDSDRRLLAEVTKRKGELMPLALPAAAGAYDIVVVDGHRAEQATVKGGVVAKELFAAVDLEAAVPRGDIPLELAPINIAFVSPLEANSFADRVENQVGLALLFGRSARLTGVDLAVGGNWVDERMTGAMLAVGINGTSGPSTGAMVALSNIALSDMTGGMVGAFNLTTATTRGAQIGLVNVGDVVTGAQVGVVNIARHATTQIGVVNIAESSVAPIGLISAIKDGQASVGVIASDFALVGVEARAGGRYVWTELVAGATPLLQATPTSILGVGVGGTVELGATRFGDGFIDIDGKGGVVGVDHAFAAVGARLRLRPVPHVNLAIGPELRLVDATGFTTARTVDVGGGFVLWPGLVVGVSL